MTKTRRGIRGFMLMILGLLVGLVGGAYVTMYIAAGGGGQAAQAPAMEVQTPEKDIFTLTVENVREAVMPAAELSTTKYYYTDADTYKNYKEAFGVKIPFTTDEVVFTYDGVISVGIDLMSVSYEIDNENKRITVILPEVRVMSNEIDASSFEYPYVFDSVFNNTNMSDYTYLIEELKQNKEAELMANSSFLQQARDNTRTVISQFLTASELCRDYTVEFR